MSLGDRTQKAIQSDQKRHEWQRSGVSSPAMIITTNENGVNDTSNVQNTIYCLFLWQSVAFGWAGYRSAVCCLSLASPRDESPRGICNEIFSVVSLKAKKNRRRQRF